MSYNTDHLRTAGKITVYTTLLGVLVFAIVFLFNLGQKEINNAVAATNATTSVTVLNTPPSWTASSTELIESSTTTPTDAGSTVSWVAIGSDANLEQYYLLICSTSATPTPNSSAAPACSSGVQWAVSTATISGTQALAATTSSSTWSESNAWFAWICDGNAGTPRCSTTYTQGTNATNSSPFEINHRPSFTIFTDNSPANPGQIVTFMSTSSDADVSGSADTVKLFVCATSGFNTTTNTCTGTTLASSSAFVAADATSTYTIVVPTQDTTFGAYGYVIDSHGFEASGGAHGSDSVLTVSNVAPTVSSSTIIINGGSDVTLTTAEGQTTGFTFAFTSSDNNSCDAVGGGSGDEVTSYQMTLYRSGIGSTTCSMGTTTLNANNCYSSSLATTTWNLSCTASTTSCTGSSDPDMVWNCTFPLWYIADPTDGVASTTQYNTENWLAQVRAIDNNSATGSATESATGVEVNSLLAYTLNTLSIPYGSLQPGQQNDPIVATTTMRATGNVGLDKTVTGESMCTTYTGSTHCPNSATSTIPESEQVFATGTVSYAQGTALSSTTGQKILIHVPKTTSTSSPATASAYWGIRVPATITYSGDYTGEDTFTGVVSNSSFW